MTKEQWLEAFQNEHGREATAGELASALLHGKIDDEAVVEPVVEPEVATEPQVVAGPEVAAEPQVAAEPEVAAEPQPTVNAESIAASQPTVDPEAPATSEVAPSTSTNSIQGGLAHFWKWVTSALKAPTADNADYRHDYGWVSLGIVALFATLASTLGLHYVVGQLTVTSPLEGYYPPELIDRSTLQNPVNVWTFLAILMMAAILALVVVLAGKVGLRLLKQQISFSGMLDRLAAPLLPAGIAFILAALLMLARLYLVGVIALWLGVILVAAVLTYVIMTANNTTELDAFYAKIVALVASFAIIAVVAMFLSRIFLQDILLKIMG